MADIPSHFVTVLQRVSLGKWLEICRSKAQCRVIGTAVTEIPSHFVAVLQRVSGKWLEICGSTVQCRVRRWHCCCHGNFQPVCGFLAASGKRLEMEFGAARLGAVVLCRWHWLP